MNLKTQFQFGLLFRVNDVINVTCHKKMSFGHTDICIYAQYDMTATLPALNYDLIDLSAEFQPLRRDCADAHVDLELHCPHMCECPSFPVTFLNDVINDFASLKPTRVKHQRVRTAQTNLFPFQTQIIISTAMLYLCIQPAFIIP